MIRIKKNDPPSPQLNKKLSQYQTYNDFATSAANNLQLLREELAKEQYYICAYCMQRIYSGAQSMRVEHWAPRNSHPHLQLKYNNLLGVCLGGEDKKREERLRHCDVSKEDKILSINPTNDKWEDIFVYKRGGAIAIREDHRNATAYNKDLETLNLNCNALKDRRRQILDTLTALFPEEDEIEAVNEETIISQLQLTEGSNELPEFIGVIRYWLKEREEFGIKYYTK